MADESGISGHLTTRRDVYHHACQVPKDGPAGFLFARIQKSLGTRGQRQARATALALDRQWHERFNQARQRSGVAVDRLGPANVSTVDWTWPDPEALANSTRPS